MDIRQAHVLSLRDTDIAGALYRLSGDEAMYSECLRAFLCDPTVEQLNISLECCAWDEAFTAAHALKGVAGNLGFIPLMHSTGQLIVLIRGGRMMDIPMALEQVNSAYRDILDGIYQYFAIADESTKEMHHEN